MLKANWKKLLSTILFLTLIALLAWYLYANRADLSRLLSLSPATVAWMLILALGACTMNCVYHKLILDTYHLSLDVVDWLGVVYAANALSFVLPMRADLIFTATYYKRVKGFALAKSASVAAGNIVFGVIFALVQFAAALLCTGLIEGQWPAVLWLILVIGAVCVGIFLLLSFRFGDHMPARLSRIRILREVITGFNDLLRNRALLIRLLLCLTANNLLHLLLYMACFRGIGMDVTIYQALFYNSISRMLNLVAIVPANIGIAQGVMGVASRLMGDVFQQGVMVSLLHSAALMVVYIVMGAIFAHPIYVRLGGASRRLFR